MKTLWGRVLFGFIAGFAFNWIMNLRFLIGFLKDLTWDTFIKAYITSFYLDLAHALSNVLFLWMFSTSWLKILRRFKREYGILE